MLPSALFSLKVFSERVSLQQNLVGQFPPVLCSLNVADAPVRLEIVEPVSNGVLDTATLVDRDESRYLSGTIRIPWFKYIPKSDFIGLDSFSYCIRTSVDTTPVVKVRIVVCPKEPGNMRVLVVVNSVLSPSIQSELNQFKADLDKEGYQARILSFSDALKNSPKALWDTLFNEYNRTNGLMAGAILVGKMPLANSILGTLVNEDESPYWCMNSYLPDLKVEADPTFYGIMRNWYNKPVRDPEQWNFDASNALHIWVSRIQAYDNVQFKGMVNELTGMKRYFKANHDYRSGITRYSHKAYFFLAFKDERDNYLSEKYLQVWNGLEQTKMDTSSPVSWYGKGGEFIDLSLHGNPGAFHEQFETSKHWARISPEDVFEAPFSIRFMMTSACNCGYPGHVVNSHILARNGGCLLAMGHNNYAGVGLNTLVWSPAAKSGDKALALLASGERWGRVMIRCGGGMRNFINFVYGDLSLKPCMYPDNPMPSVTSLSADKLNGVVPFTVNLLANATDDGSINSYEWFPKGYNFGIDDPVASGLGNTLQTTYTKPYLYRARVEAVDNYNARGRKTIDIAVAPNPAETLRVYCGKPRPFHIANLEKIDAYGHRFFHNQLYVPGTWGFVVSSTPTDSPALEPYNLLTVLNSTNIKNTGNDEIYRNAVMPAGDGRNPDIWYKIPLQNGTYSLVLGFSDNQFIVSKGNKALMDIEACGVVFRTGWSPVDTVGAQTACNIFTVVNVTDGELEFKIKPNSGSLAPVFLNWFEVYPGVLPNAASAAEESEKDSIAMLRVSPNPFNPQTRITFALPKTKAANPFSVKVYSTEGRLIRTILENVNVAGRQSAVWDGRNNSGVPVATGIYVVRVIHGRTVLQKQALLIK